MSRIQDSLVRRRQDRQWLVGWHRVLENVRGYSLPIKSGRQAFQKDEIARDSMWLAFLSFPGLTIRFPTSSNQSQSSPVRSLQNQAISFGKISNCFALC